MNEKRSSSSTTTNSPLRVTLTPVLPEADFRNRSMVYLTRRRVDGKRKKEEKEKKREIMKERGIISDEHCPSGAPNISSCILLLAFFFLHSSSSLLLAFLFFKIFRLLFHFHFVFDPFSSSTTTRQFFIVTSLTTMPLVMSGRISLPK